MLIHKIHKGTDSADILEDIVCGKAPANFELGVDILEILDISILICIRKDKIKWPFESFYQLTGIPQSEIHKFRQIHSFQIFDGFLLSARIDFDGDQFPSGFTECLGHPNGGMPCRSPDFQGGLVIVF